MITAHWMLLALLFTAGFYAGIGISILMVNTIRKFYDTQQKGTQP